MGTGNKDNKKQHPKDEEKEQQEEDGGNKEKIHEQIDEVKVIWITQSILLLNHILLLISYVSKNLKWSLFNSEVRLEKKRWLISELKANHITSIL